MTSRFEQEHNEQPNQALEAWNRAIPNDPNRTYQGLQREDLLALVDQGIGFSLDAQTDETTIVIQDIEIQLREARRLFRNTPKTVQERFVLDASGRIVKHEGLIPRHQSDPEFEYEYCYNEDGRLTREDVIVRHPYGYIVHSYERIYSYDGNGEPTMRQNTHIFMPFLTIRGKGLV